MNPLSFALFGALGFGPAPTALSLDQALDLARTHRPAVRAAQLRLESFRRQSNSLSAPAPTRLDFQATTNQELYGNDDDIVLSQSIDLFGRGRANRAVGAAQIRLAEANFRQVLLEIQGDVVESYSDAVATRMLAQSARAQLELAERLLNATQKRADGGIVPPVQVKRVNLEVQRAQQTLALRQATELAARRRLAAAVGISVEQVAVGEDFPAVPANAPIDLSQRADLLAISAQIAIERANIGISRVQFRPEFEVSARASFYSYGSNRPAGLRATLSLPIFDFGRQRNEVKAGQAAAEAEQNALSDATARAYAELEAVNIELRAANAQTASFERLLADTRELVRISDVGYREGATTLLEVLEANRALREVEESLVESRLRVAQAQAAYLRTTGTLLGGSSR